MSSTGPDARLSAFVYMHIVSYNHPWQGTGLPTAEGATQGWLHWMNTPAHRHTSTVSHAHGQVSPLWLSAVLACTGPQHVLQAFHAQTHARPHHGVQRLEVALDLLRRRLDALRVVLDHAAHLLAVAVHVVQDARGLSAIAPSPACSGVGWEQEQVRCVCVSQRVRRMQRRAGWMARVAPDRH